MATRADVFFLTAYMGHLMGDGIRSEQVYVVDASRFLRFLLERSCERDVEEFVASRARLSAVRQTAARQNPAIRPLHAGGGRIAAFLRRRFAGSIDRPAALKYTYAGQRTLAGGGV